MEVVEFELSPCITSFPYIRTDHAPTTTVAVLTTNCCSAKRTFLVLVANYSFIVPERTLCLVWNKTLLCSGDDKFCSLLVGDVLSAGLSWTCWQTSARRRPRVARSSPTSKTFRFVFPPVNYIVSVIDSYRLT